MLALPFCVVLASASPRRKELLRTVVSSFQIDPADIDEEAFTSADPWKTAGDIAREKARTVSSRHPESLVIAADTVVSLPGPHGYKQFAKPADAEDARRMLSELAGREHDVITGVCLILGNSLWDLIETTRVKFRPLTDLEIRDYVASGEPLDKAGAYAIQGGAKEFVVSRHGSLSNVIGLPIEALEERLVALAERE